MRTALRMEPGNAELAELEMDEVAFDAILERAEPAELVPSPPAAWARTVYLPVGSGGLMPSTDNEAFGHLVS